MMKQILSKLLILSRVDSALPVNNPESPVYLESRSDKISSISAV